MGRRRLYRQRGPYFFGMNVVPGPWLLALLNGVVLFVAGGVAWALLRSGSDGSAPDESAWLIETGRLAREVQQVAEHGSTPTDYDRVDRTLLPLAGRIQGHVRTAPSSVDDAIYRVLFELGVACQRVALEHRPAMQVDGPFLEDRLQSLRSKADAVVAAVDAYSKPRSKTENAT